MGFVLQDKKPVPLSQSVGMNPGKRGRATSGISEERDPGVPVSLPDPTRRLQRALLIISTDRQPITGYREKHGTKRLEITAGSARRGVNNNNNFIDPYT